MNLHLTCVQRVCCHCVVQTLRRRCVMRRGRIQRIRDQEEALADGRINVDGGSHLCQALLEQWAWGLLSATSVQALAQGALLDGLSNASVQTLAGLGSSGAHPDHARRDLLSRCFRGGVLPFMTSIPAPMQDLSRNVVEGDVKVLLPSEVLSWMWANFRARFDNFLGTGLRDFWSQVKPNDPKLQGHPMCEREDWMEKASPLVFHGD